jgi:hypothetical protein
MPPIWFGENPGSTFKPSIFKRLKTDTSILICLLGLICLYPLGGFCKQVIAHFKLDRRSIKAKGKASKNFWGQPLHSFIKSLNAEGAFLGYHLTFWVVLYELFFNHFGFLNDPLLFRNRSKSKNGFWLKHRYLLVF